MNTNAKNSPRASKGYLIFTITVLIISYVFYAIQKKECSDSDLFCRLPYEVDDNCKDYSKYYFRTLDGSCNWMKKGEYEIGKAGNAYGRERSARYVDGISEPRKGPNPRELSNAFFKNNKTIPFNHTPFLTAVVQYLMHDVSFTQYDHKQPDPVNVPQCDPFFDPDCHGDRQLHLYKSKAVPGTGTNTSNPREHINFATSWIDLSPLYGTTSEIADALRTFEGGKLKTMKGPDGGDYMPLGNFPQFSLNRNKEAIFASGDERTNQNYLLITIHTLFLREHNRVCDLLSTKYPTWNDEKIYQTARIIVSAKLHNIATAYMMNYYVNMPFPDFDGHSLMRILKEEKFWNVHPFKSYPIPDSISKENKPIIATHEMVIGYQFHDLIPHNLTLLDSEYKATKNIKLVDYAFNATAYLSDGLENIVRGALKSTIPNFHSGVQDSLRNVLFNMADPKWKGGFDIVSSMIQHERERGLPTFNQYFAEYSEKMPFRQRKTFEDFSSNPEFVKDLKRLYKSPDDVDFFVGLQLDEELYPFMQIPKSMVVVNLPTLYGLGASDRFSCLYAITHCILVDRPWNCKPTNILQELMWEPYPLPLFPNARKLSTFWMKELYMEDCTDGLRDLVTKNTNIGCMQKNLFFPEDPKTNPLVC